MVSGQRVATDAEASARVALGELKAAIDAWIKTDDTNGIDFVINLSALVDDALADAPSVFVLSIEAPDWTRRDTVHATLASVEAAVRAIAAPLTPGVATMSHEDVADLLTDHSYSVTLTECRLTDDVNDPIPETMPELVL